MNSSAVRPTAEYSMLPFKLIYSDDYYLPIGEHVFPAEKYRRIHDRLLETGIVETRDFLTPQLASDEDILLVHTPDYVRSSRLEPSLLRKRCRWRFPTRRN